MLRKKHPASVAAGAGCEANLAFASVAAESEQSQLSRMCFRRGRSFCDGWETVFSDRQDAR